MSVSFLRIYNLGRLALRTAYKEKYETSILPTLLPVEQTKLMSLLVSPSVEDPCEDVVDIDIVAKYPYIELRQCDIHLSLDQISYFSLRKNELYQRFSFIPSRSYLSMKTRK